MKHTITAPEHNYGYIECPVFSGLKSGHAFAGVKLEYASGDTELYEKNSRFGDFHIHNGVKNRVDGLKWILSQLGDEIDVIYDSNSNIIILKEIPLEPSEKELAKQAAKIQNMIKNGLA